jgi:hypothetical protein
LLFPHLFYTIEVCRNICFSCLSSRVFSFLLLSLLPKDI